MVFVIFKTVPGRGRVYVAPPGQMKSYTTSVNAAWAFPSYALAEAEKCGDERIICIDTKG